MAMQLEGMQELLEHLNRINLQITDDLTEKALKEGAELIKNDAKQIVRKDTHKLQNHIIVSNVKDGGVDIGPSQQGDAFYGYILEFGRKAGTRKYGRNKKYRYPAMPPYPFMGPAFESNKEKVQEKMAQVIKRELNI